MKKIFENTEKLFLYTGIFAFLLGLVLLSYCGKHENSQQPLFVYLMIFPPIFSLSLVLVFASIIEEFAFRGWIIKNKAGKIVSYIGILVFMYLTFNSYLLLSLISATIFVVFFIIKNDKWKTTSRIIITSLLFGLVHFYNYSDSFTRLFSIIQLIGLSFIISYVGLKFGFWYCTLVHFLNNLIAMLILFIFLNTDYTGNFENNSYQAKLTKTPLTDFSFGSMNVTSNKFISYNSHITKIAERVADHGSKTIFKSHITNLTKYKFTAIAKKDTINQKQLFDDIIKHANLKLDTTYEEAYIMSISDTAKLYNIKELENTYLSSMDVLMISIRDIYNIPLIIENSITYPMFNLDINVLQIKSKQDLIKHLRDEYGINIEKSVDKKAMVITIREAP